MPPIAADNKHIQISLDTHIFFTTLSSFWSVRVCANRLQLADSNFRAKVHRVLPPCVGVLHALPLNSALGETSQPFSIT